MSDAVDDELEGWISDAAYETLMRGRKAGMTRALLKAVPEVREELINEGQLVEAREGLLRVLARRKLIAGSADKARIAACADLATLHRWLDQAIDAPSAAEALR